MKLSRLGIAAAMICCASTYGQTPCDAPLNQNASDALEGVGVACADAGITAANIFGRSFDLSALYPGEAYQMSCVSVGVSNSGVLDVNAAINVYIDSDGGAPVNATTDLVLQTSEPFVIAGGASEIAIVNLATPLCIPADSVVFIELAIEASTDGFVVYDGNAAGQSGPTYVGSECLGTGQYTTMTAIGFPANFMYLTAGGTLGCDGNACDCTLTNDCQYAHSYPGCEDPICEAIVCTFDDFCCTGEWDSTCAATALSFCGTTGFDCEFPTEACTYTELEACGGDLNGGCNSDTPLYETISVGERVCGTFQADTETRDTDWYQFSLDQRSVVNWTVYSRVNVTVLIIRVNECNIDVDGNDDITIVAVGDASGSCPNTATNCLDAGNYVAFVSPIVEGGLPCGTLDFNDYYGVLTADAVSVCPGVEECGPFEASYTENSDIVPTAGDIACAGNNITTENTFARSYDSAAGEIPAEEFEINCVEFGIANSGSALPIFVRVYLDNDGGAPTAPGTDLTELGFREGIALANSEGMQRVVFDPAVCVPANSTIVVALDITPHTDGFCGIYGNDLPATGPTYILSASCGLTTFNDLAAIGSPGQLVQILNVNNSCGGSGPDCPGDFNGDGAVDGADFGSILAAWGACAGCPEDLNEDGTVNGSDVGLILSYWGDCAP
jgi:hypothetical protein